MAEAKVRVGMDGEAKFKQDLAAINSELKTLSTETKAVTSAFIGNEKSVESLNAKNQQLEKTLDTENKKLELLKDRLEQAKAEGNAKDIAKYEQAVNLTTAEINKMNAELAQNQQELKKVNSEAASAKWDSFKDGAAAAGKAIAAIGAAALAAVASIAKMTLSAASAADEINTLSVQTGISTDELQRFRYASEVIDVSVETLTGSMTKLTKNMASAKDGSGSAASAFQQLGIAVTDSEGNLRDRNEVFNETIAALGGVENATERDALAMQIFGKSAQELNPLILGGADALKELGDQAASAGLILSQTELQSLNSLNDSMDMLQSTATAAGNVMTVAFAEPMAGALDFARGALERLVVAFREGGLDSVATELGSVIADGAAKMAEELPKIVQFGTEIVTSLISGLAQALPSVLEAVLKGATSVITSVAESLPTLIPTLVTALLDSLIVALENIDPLLEALLSGLQALVDGVIEALPIIIDKVPVIIDALITALIDAIPLLIDAGVELLTSIVTALPEIIKGVCDAIPKIVDGLVSALTESDTLQKIIEAGVTLFIALIENLPKIIVEIVKAVPKIVESIVKAFGGLAGKIIEVGGNLIKGIWQGIKDAGAWLREKISGFFNGVVDSIKNFFGIHSPSTLFAGIGEMLDFGLAEGIEGASGVVLKAQETLGEKLRKAAGVALEAPVQMVVTSPSLSAAIQRNNEMTINITETLDGEVIARNSFAYAPTISAQRGVIFTGG